MALCARCERFDVQSLINGFPPLSYDLGVVIEAEANGCCFCTLLVEKIRTALSLRADKSARRILRLDKSRQALSFLNRYGPLQVHFWMTQSENASHDGRCLYMTHLNAFVGRHWWFTDSPMDDSVSFHTAADPGTPAQVSGDIAGEIQTETRPWTETQFSTINVWHKNCRQNHPNCNKTLSKNRSFDVENVALPTRYVEIIADEEMVSDMSALRFVLREAHGETGTYIALSHLWTEQDQHARTTTSNYMCRLGSCHHRSPCSSWTREPLTHLFVEASWVAINLGIKNIWIDSICIIQDDPNDWTTESVKMAEYYQFAWLTISATHVTPDGGLRTDLQPAEIPRLTRLPYRDKAGNQQGYFYLQSVEKYALARDYRDKVSKSKLLKRGWVYQEWLLSRRILCFSDSSWGIFMQCQSGDSPKTVTGDVVGAETSADSQPGLIVDKAFKSSMQLDGFSANAILKSWRSVVETYSGLELRYIESDRLVALSGIAAEYGQSLQAIQPTNPSEGEGEHISLNKVYACGLWLADIRGLLWEQAEKQAASRIPGISTWSWASLARKKASETEEASPRGLSVRWPSGTNIDYGELVCTGETAVALPVSTTTWQPNFAEVSHSLPGNLYGNENRFAVLKMRGRLLQVSIDAPFDFDDANIVADLSDHHPNFGRRDWRKVATRSTPELVAGWASLDHPEYQNDAACRTANTIVALFMVKFPSSKRSFGLGNLFKKHIIYRVLYLRKVDRPNYSPCYERVGVGRLFENEVTALFEAAKEESIWIV